MSFLNCIYTAFLSFSLVGCSSNVTPLDSFEVERPFFQIKGKNKSLSTDLIIREYDLIFDDIILVSWPLHTTPCTRCNVILDRRFNPDGPTTWLILESELGVKTWVVSSFQSSFHVAGWRFIKNESTIEATKLETEETTPIPSQLNSTFRLNTENKCEVLWMKNEALEKPPAQISKDVAKFKLQIILQCQG